MPITTPLTGDLSSPGSNRWATEYKNAFWGDPYYHEVQPLEYLELHEGARDLGNTNDTTHLRHGLVVAKRVSDGLLTDWDPTSAVNGEAVPYGVLSYAVDMAPYGTALANQRPYTVHIAGRLLTDQIIMPGQATRGIDQGPYKFALIEAWKERFLFGPSLPFQVSGGVQPLTASATLTEAQHGQTFSNRGAGGAITLTLPTAVEGLTYGFVRDAAENLVISGTIINAAGTSAGSVTLNSGGQTLRIKGVRRAASVTWVETSL